jgi:hypothetical protein
MAIPKHQEGVKEGDKSTPATGERKHTAMGARSDIARPKSAHLTTMHGAAVMERESGAWRNYRCKKSSG